MRLNDTLSENHENKVFLFYVQSAHTRTIWRFVSLIMQNTSSVFNTHWLYLRPPRRTTRTRSAARTEAAAEAAAALCRRKSTACRRRSAFSSPTRSTTGGWRSWRAPTWGTWPTWRGCTSARGRTGMEEGRMTTFWGEGETVRRSKWSGQKCSAVPYRCWFML